MEETETYNRLYWIERRSAMRTLRTGSIRLSDHFINVGSKATGADDDDDDVSINDCLVGNRGLPIFGWMNSTNVALGSSPAITKRSIGDEYRQVVNDREGRRPVHDKQLFKNPRSSPLHPYHPVKTRKTTFCC